MSDTEAQVRQLLEVAVGVPPNSISVSKVRRLARRRRARHGIAAASSAAATCAAVSVLALGLTGPLSGHTPQSSPRAASVPRYYIQEHDFDSGYTPPAGYKLALVRDTASGAVKAAVRCPWKGATIAGIAPADDEVFFLACQLDYGRRTAGSRLYRFQLTSAGRVRGFAPVPGGILTGIATAGLTAAANGSELAMIASGNTSGLPASHGILVINTSTGAHANWSARAGFFSNSVTLSPDGRDLRFLEGVEVSKEAAIFEELQVSPASRGGLLSSARVLVRFAANPNNTAAYYAQVSPDGSVLTAVTNQVTRPNSGRLKLTWVIEQISVPSGRVIRVLFRASTALSFIDFTQTSSDPTGRYIMFFYGTGLSKPDYHNGWLDHGRLAPLAPAHGIPAQNDQKGLSIGPETW